MIRFRKNPYQDQDILDGILKGGAVRERAVKTLYQSHLGYIYKGANKFKLKEEEAADAYNDAILAVVIQVQKGAFQQKSRLSTYLFQIFRFKCVDRIKKNKTHDHIPWEEVFPQLQDESRDFLRDFMGKERWKQAKELLRQLGESCMKILLLAAEGYKPADIALEMDLKNAHTAKSRKYKCTQRFSELLKKRGVEL